MKPLTLFKIVRYFIILPLHYGLLSFQAQEKKTESVSLVGKKK